MPPRVVTIVLSVLVFSAGLLVGGVSGWQLGREHAVQNARGLGIGQRPPDFAVQDLAGASQSLQQHKGRVVVLHFWASWCGFCRSEIPELLALHNEWSARGVDVLTVSIDRQPEQLRQFLAATPLPYPIIVDQEQGDLLASRFDVSGIPVTYIVDRDGRIALHLQGASDITAAVRETLGASS